MTEDDVHAFEVEGKSAFERGDFSGAVQAFTQAAEWYATHAQAVKAAEMKNNLSVALLKLDRAEEALQAALGTDEIFAKSGDLRYQGMALGNQAAALEALGKLDEAIKLYERSAEIFAEAGEGDMQSLVLQAMAGIHVRRGKFEQSGIEMLGSLGAAKNPTWIQRLLKFLLRILPF
ncbi:MAG: tetratricopeptide repeat protein [Candidatus Villigracilaceae bacterium]